MRYRTLPDDPGRLLTTLERRKRRLTWQYTSPSPHYKRGLRAYGSRQDSLITQRSQFKVPPALTAWRTILAFGVVSLAGDMGYEGMRSVSGPILASLGASAVVVGLVGHGSRALRTIDEGPPMSTICPSGRCGASEFTPATAAEASPMPCWTVPSRTRGRSRHRRSRAIRWTTRVRRSISRWPTWAPARSSSEPALPKPPTRTRSPVGSLA